MSGYGSSKWTCGECGESWEASGVVADLQVDRWARDHREMHRVQKMSEDEQVEYLNRKMEAMALSREFDPAPGPPMSVREAEERRDKTGSALP